MLFFDTLTNFVWFLVIGEKLFGKIIITRTYIRVPDTNAQRFAIPGKVGDLLSHI